MRENLLESANHIIQDRDFVTTTQANHSGTDRDEFAINNATITKQSDNLATLNITNTHLTVVLGDDSTVNLYSF